MPSFISPQKSGHKAMSGLALLATTILSVVLAPSAVSASAATSTEKTASNRVTIGESGSTLLEPLFDLWAEAYQEKDPAVTVTPSGGRSGKGISDVIGGTVDIGASDAYLSGSDRSEAAGIQDIALAISSQMVNYNVSGVPANTHLKLSGAVLSAIYEGKITQWDDFQIRALNPGVRIPAEKIVALHRSDSSGDTFLFSTYLSDADPSGWGGKIGYGTSISFPNISNALGETGNGGMVSGCQKTPGCVAYIGISYKSATQKAGLGESQLENASAHFELPTATTIDAEAASFISQIPPDEAISMIYGKAPAGYPIVNYEYAILPAKEQNSTTAQAVGSFLKWVVAPSGGNSATYLGPVNFQPLPTSVMKLSDKLISKIGG